VANGQVFTNAGRAIATNLVSGIGGTIPHWIQWGIGTTTPVAADTAIQTNSTNAEARTVGTVSRTTVSVTNDNYRVTGTITCGASAQAITEVGLFDALTVGNMWMHAVFSAVNVVLNDSIAFTIDWQLT
jgi:hypothetical protein